jgi:16S rRNA (guanine527-N7)-methyltransferase
MLATVFCSTWNKFMQHNENNRDLILEGAKRLGIRLSQKDSSQFLLYLKTLKYWSSRINLTAIRDDRGIIIRHFLDSLAGLAILPGEKPTSNRKILLETSYRVMDVGTGAGFPGLPLKICRPQIILTLVEPSNKKAAFLHSICGQLGLKGVNILTERLEAIVQQPQHQRAYDYIVSRALRPSKFLGPAVFLLRPGGRVVLWVSQKDESLLKEINNLPGWGQPEPISYRLPFENIERWLILLTKSNNTKKV